MVVTEGYEVHCKCIAWHWYLSHVLFHIYIGFHILNASISKHSEVQIGMFNYRILLCRVFFSIMFVLIFLTKSVKQYLTSALQNILRVELQRESMKYCPNWQIWPTHSGNRHVMSYLNPFCKSR